jgi:hypothetical protein
MEFLAAIRKEKIVVYLKHYLIVGKLQNATNSGLSCSEYY